MPVTDFLHDEAVVDAVLDEMKDHLPSAWTTKPSSGGNPAFYLKRLEYGALRDYRDETPATVEKLCPLIIAKSMGNDWNRQRSGLGGKQAINYAIRVVHLWHWDHCLSTSTNRRVSPARSQAQRLKKLNIALFTASDRQLGNPTLTCADTGITARVNVVEFVASHMEGVEDVDLLPSRFYAVAVDLNVITTTA